MEKKHAENLISKGEVYLCNLKSFTKGTHGGKIDDQTEGKIKISNFYQSYIGRAKDAEGLIPLYYPPHGIVNFYNQNISLEIEDPDSLVFCASSLLLSDSLSWAIKEGKETCIMILDSAKFFNDVSSELKNEYYSAGMKSCDYIKDEKGKFQENNPNIYSLTNGYCSNQKLISYTKPKIFEEQREVRMAFFKKNESPDKIKEELEPLTVNINNDNNYIKILFDNADSKILMDENLGDIEIKVNRLNGAPTTFKVEHPRALYTPIIYRKEGNFLGFSYPSEDNSYGGVTVSNCDYGILNDGGIPLIALNKISNIESIEILTHKK